MKYIKVEWLHDFVDEPSDLYYEMDENRFESRKVEIYKNGKVGYADANKEVGGARLGFLQIPDITVIGEDPEFRPKEISKEEFESIWNRFVLDSFSDICFGLHTVPKAYNDYPGRPWRRRNIKGHCFW